MIYNAFFIDDDTSGSVNHPILRLDMKPFTMFHAIFGCNV